MLSRKTEEIHIDEYIKKLALDNSVVTSKDGMPRSIRYIFLDNNSSVSKVRTTLPVAPHSCIPTHNTPNRGGKFSDQISGVFSTEQMCENPSHLVDFPEVGYLNTANSFSPAASLAKPSWLVNLSSLPPIYGDAIRAAKTSYGLDSSIIYEIFRSSNLSTEALYHIWSLTSCTQPGWFTPTELVTALALIGLAQRKQWEFQSCSLSETITIQSLYGQICPPVPMIQIPNSSRPPNSTDTIFGSELVTHGNPPASFRDPVISGCSKFPFQPPVVAFPAFSNRLDNDSCHQSIQSSTDSSTLNNSVYKTPDPFMHFVSSGTLSINDPEWSDFASFNTSVKQSEHNSNNIPEVSTEVGINGQKKSLTRQFQTSHISLFDEEFGNFQTSYSVNVSKPTEILDKLPHSNSLTTANNNNLLKLPIQKSAYNDVQNKMNSSESLYEQWLHCLTDCLKVFNDSLLVLSSLKSMEDQFEFAESEEGCNFLLVNQKSYMLFRFIADATEIYLMTRRISISAKNYNVIDSSMHQLFSDIENSFRKLSSYAVVTDLKNKIGQAFNFVSTSENEFVIQDFINSTTFSYCGVCLSSINLTNDQCVNNHCNESSSFSQQTNYHLVYINLAGRCYHISCANFWMNRINPCLPALKIPL
ncbi:unnamed protein product [Schistosoma margrebowiei]|uniref:Uncharacterized protein n=1 Tax=Schistosoma margrebowiei TaxID=48269 RepID=A0A183MJF3_9TREM|nr:unnamed protein product [Schistosoma margrebowiei]